MIFVVYLVAICIMLTEQFSSIGTVRYWVVCTCSKCVKFWCGYNIVACVFCFFGSWMHLMLCHLPAHDILMATSTQGDNTDAHCFCWHYVCIKIQLRLWLISSYFRWKCDEKVKSGTCCSASYTRWTYGRKRFTISELADWHELMILRCTMQPSIARINKQLDPRFAASRHTTAPISHTRPSPRT